MTRIAKTKIPLFPINLWLEHDPAMNNCGDTRYCEVGIVAVRLRSMDDATVMHEAIHVVQFVQKHIDTILDEETFAYLAEWCFTYCNTKIKNYLMKVAEINNEEEEQSK